MRLAGKPYATFYTARIARVNSDFQSRRGEPTLRGSDQLQGTQALHAVDLVVEEWLLLVEL
jgi:hypothetical protein